MEKTAFETLDIGDLVRHQNGKLYMLIHVTPPSPDQIRHAWDPIRAVYSVDLIGYDALVFAQSHTGRQMVANGRALYFPARDVQHFFRQWQVNEKHPKGRLYQATRILTHDRVERA